METPAKRTVLIVEDEVMLRTSVSKVLRREGFNVIEADDGSAAVDLFRRHDREIDLVLLDLTIPGTTSTAVVEEAARIRPDIRVILTSAYGRDMAGATANAAQVRGFIRKPFRISELVGMIQKTLSG
jgi:DNA-binding NtrC family response regulator